MVFKAGFTVQALLGHDQVVFIERWSLDTSGRDRSHCTDSLKQPSHRRYSIYMYDETNSLLRMVTPNDSIAVPTLFSSTHV